MQNDVSVQYSERVIGFIDCLGFSEAVKASDSDSSKVEKIAGLLSGYADPTYVDGDRLHKKYSSDVIKTTFSDHIVVSATKNAAGLSAVVGELNETSMKMLRAGFLSRGAITVGKIFHNANLMFGPGFIECYRLESTIAKHPRVILGKSALFLLLDDAARHELSMRGIIEELILRDEGDGLAYVNPFFLLTATGKPFFNKIFGGNVSQEDVRLEVKEKIMSMIPSSYAAPDVFSKYVWLVNELSGHLVDYNGPDAILDPGSWMSRNGVTLKTRTRHEDWARWA